MDNLEEKKIESAFKQLAEKANNKAPSFDAMWQEAVNSKEIKTRRFKVGSIAATIGLIIATSATLLLYKTCASIHNTNTLMALTAWTSPTDVLLKKNSVYSIGNIKSFPSDRILEFEIEEVNEDILTDK